MDIDPFQGSCLWVFLAVKPFLSHPEFLYHAGTSFANFDTLKEPELRVNGIYCIIYLLQRLTSGELVLDPLTVQFRISLAPAFQLQVAIRVMIPA